MEEQQQRNIPSLGMSWNGALRMPKVLEFIGGKRVKELLLAPLVDFGCSVYCEVIWVIITKLISGVENEICSFWMPNLSVLMKQKEQLEQEEWEQQDKRECLCC